jgi:protein SCO1
MWVFVLICVVLPSFVWLMVEAYENTVERLPVLGITKMNSAAGTAHRIGHFKLLNQDNKIVTTDDWNNKIVVVDFFFSHCSSVCPKMTATLKAIQVSLKNDGDIKICSFSVDPERDSATQLKKYADRLGIDTQNWDLLTGAKKEIYKLARNSFMIVATDGDGGPDDFIHSEKLVLLDRQQRIRGYYNGTSDSETRQLLRDIKKLKNED